MYVESNLWIRLLYQITYSNYCTKFVEFEFRIKGIEKRIKWGHPIEFSNWVECQTVNSNSNISNHKIDNYATKYPSIRKIYNYVVYVFGQWFDFLEM